MPNEWGNSCTASYVSWDSASKIVVGDSAKDTASTNPKATISSLKTILGRRFRDPFVQGFKTSVQYPIVDQAGLPHIRLDYKSKDGKDVTLVVSPSALVPLLSSHVHAAKPPIPLSPHVLLLSCRSPSRARQAAYWPS